MFISSLSQKHNDVPTSVVKNTKDDSLTGMNLHYSTSELISKVFLEEIHITSQCVKQEALSWFGENKK